MTLQNFTSIFEIVFAYNVGIAFSKDFRHLLGINENIRRLIEHHREYQFLKRFAARESIYSPAFNPNRIRYLNDQFVSVKKKMTLYFTNGKLEKFLRPYYVFFGMLSMAYLVLAGLIGDVMDCIHLMFLNFVAFLVAIWGFYHSFRIRLINYTQGNVRYFFGSVLIILVALVIPEVAIAPLSFDIEGFYVMGFIL